MVRARRVGVVGLGYVGLPVAIAFAEAYRTVGFDIDETRISELARGVDRTREVDPDRLRATSARFTADPVALADSNFLIITVPTPTDQHNRPDLSALKAASHTVGSVIKPGSIIVFESTVFPGATEGVCKPIIEGASGLTHGTDFFLGYSPERINPGDPQHRFENIAKVVSGDSDSTLDTVAAMYESVISAPIHRASSIAVAEAAKVIENTQRDLNIALMNELAIIFDRLGIDTQAVLSAAGTKWNFMPFRPGLVGGHCIGVDPYYLTSRAQDVGIEPQVILAGRRMNDGMGAHVADSTIRRLIQLGVDMRSCRVLVIGLSFKPNVPDFRNTGVVGITERLQEFGLLCDVWDPLCDAAAVENDLGISLVNEPDPSGYAVYVLAVPHDSVVSTVQRWVSEHQPRLLVDINRRLDPDSLPDNVSYWGL